MPYFKFDTSSFVLFCSRLNRKPSDLPPVTWALGPGTYHGVWDTCDGSFCMLTWLSHRGAQIKHDFWVCLCGCFRTRWAFVSVDSQIALPNVGGHPPTHPRVWIEQNMEEWGVHAFSFQPCCSTWDILPHVLLPLDQDLHHLLNSNWSYITSFPGSSACRWQIWDFSAPIIVWANSS